MLDIRELYQYSHSVRRKFAQRLAGMSWDDVSKNREASFYSMKNILLHMIDNEDWIVNWVAKDKASEYKRQKKSEEYLSMEQVLNHLKEVEARTESYLAKITDEELSAHVKLILQSSGRSFDLSVEECLFQSFTEQLYHIGELIALFWQQDIEPPQMQWFYNNPRVKNG